MPFLKNTWYVAANAYELDEGMVSRKICNQPIVMYRTSTGAIAALHDRCPHRFVPLSMGKRVGDTVQCGYHGLRFDATGACAEAPNDDDAQRARICVTAYPAVERYAVVWLWMGDPALATPETIPDFSYLTNREKFAVCQGYTHIKGSYQLLSDNLLDLSHIHYLHPQISSDRADFNTYTNEVKVDGETVWSMLWRHKHDLGMQAKMLGFASTEGEGQGHSRWDAPGVLLVETAYWEKGKSIEHGIETPSSHLITPETETTCHYFWGSGRTYALDNEQMSQMIAQTMKTVFETQDGPMVEAQQRDMGEITDFLDMRPTILKADAAGVLARRVLKKKIRDEQARESATAGQPKQAVG
jgi:phenylpropionate dioxygenase-like ring-hydroxylating dioxygenase large terminal subunit